MYYEDEVESPLLEKELAPVDIELYQNIKVKLSLKACQAVFKFKPHDAQVEILEVIQEGAFNTLTLTCGRRFGKSELLSFVATTELLIPNSRVLLITPSYANAKAIFDKVITAVMRANLKILKKDSKLMTFELEAGNTFIVATPKSISNVLGFRYSLVIIDESQDVSHLMENIENKIAPAQADFGERADGFNFSKTVFIGTARTDDNEFFIPFERGIDKVFGYKSFNYPTECNPYISKNYIEKKRQTLPQREFEQEYMGIWQKTNDANIYYAFNKDIHVLPHQQILEKIHPDGLFYSGLDFGFNDNQSLILAYYAKDTGTIYIIDEYVANQRTTKEHHKNFIELETANGIHASSGKGFSGTGGTNYTRFGDPTARQTINDLAVDYSYFINNASNDIIEGIKVINTMFHNNKIIISDKCQRLIKEIGKLAWQNEATKTVARNKDFGHFDMSFGAFRYLVYSVKKQFDVFVQVV